MRRPLFAAALLLPLTAARVAAPNADPADLVQRAVTAVGGEAALRGLTSATIWVRNVSLQMGQEETPLSTPGGGVNFGRITLDWVARSQRFDIEIPVNTTTPVRITQIATPEVAVAVQNGVPRLAPVVALNVARNLDRAMPRQLLLLLDHPGAIRPAPVRTIRGEPADGILYAFERDTFSLWFDRATGLPLQQETVADDPIRGDAVATTTWTSWSRDAVRWPGQSTTAINGVITSIASQRVEALNRPLPDSLFAISDSLRAAARNQPAGVPPVAIAMRELAPGVHRVAGSGYASLVVEQGERLLLIEAPLSAQHTQAILDTLASRFPGKRVSQVVNTHHHWDHAGGLRTVLAAGIPVVTHERNVAFVRGVGTARKTKQPDALSRRGRLPAITGVADSMTIGSGAGRVQLFRMESVHGPAILAAFIPEAGILFQSDVLAPGPNMARAGAAEVVAFARERGLAVRRVAGGHGDVAAMDAVERAAQP